MWQHDLIIYILSRYAFKSNNISTVYKNGSMYDVYIYIYILYDGSFRQLTQLCWILDVRI